MSNKLQLLAGLCVVVIAFGQGCSKQSSDAAATNAGTSTTQKTDGSTEPVELAQARRCCGR